MLLTSSQVSIAASSSVVVVFTTALFLSGYAIQQRTLRDLREAIKPSPRPKPQIFLPDRFRATTTELEDGTVVIVEVDSENAYRPPRLEGEEQRQQVVVEITPTLAEDERGLREGDEGIGELRDTKKEMQRERSDSDAENEGAKEGEKTQKKEAKTKRPKKISRAERRRQIKEEIQRLAQGDRKGLWQPRLW